MIKNILAIVKKKLSQQKHDFIYKNIKYAHVPKIISKVVNELLFKSYENFQFFQKYAY